MDNPVEIARAIEDFLTGHPRAVAVEDGGLLFDFATARFSVSTEHAKCVLQLWSPERSAVRRVVAAELKGDHLRLKVMRFGQSKPIALTLSRERDQRTPTERRAARRSFAARLRGFLEARFSGYTIEQFSSDADAQRSFSPVYTRALLRQGSSSFALIAVNAQEDQASIDGALTIGILWLDYCRQRSAGRGSHVEGLRLFVPPGTSATLAERIAHLNPEAARWRLYEWDERNPALTEIDPADRGNVETRLVHRADEQAARERFHRSIGEVQQLVPGAPLDLHVRGSGEVAFRLHGLELARARLEPQAGSFQLVEQVSFGAGANETILTDENRERMRQLVEQAVAIRHPAGERNHPLWRMTPERWLESLVARDVRVLDGNLLASPVYAQVPAMAGGERGLIDLVGVTRDGRLVVIELKAGEDIHLPLQGVDYWARVEWHRQRGEFERHGYFPGLVLSPQPPLLVLACPALHVHPATDTILRYLSPKIDLTLVALDERWREHLRVIFRKRPERGQAALH